MSEAQDIVLAWFENQGLYVTAPTDVREGRARELLEMLRAAPKASATCSACRGRGSVTEYVEDGAGICGINGRMCAVCNGTGRERAQPVYTGTIDGSRLPVDMTGAPPVEAPNAGHDAKGPWLVRKQIDDRNGLHFLCAIGETPWWSQQCKAMRFPEFSDAFYTGGHLDEPVLIVEEDSALAAADRPSQADIGDAVERIADTHCAHCGKERDYHHEKRCRWHRRCQYVLDRGSLGCGSLADVVVVSRKDMGACAECLERARRLGDDEETMPYADWVAARYPDESPSPSSGPSPPRACIDAGECQRNAIEERIRRETIEECAKVCDGRWKHYDVLAGGPSAVKGDRHMSAGAGECADEIRKLAAKLARESADGSGSAEKK